jgi:hypothetical protein
MLVSTWLPGSFERFAFVIRQSFTDIVSLSATEIHSIPSYRLWASLREGNCEMVIMIANHW